MPALAVHQLGLPNLELRPLAGPALVRTIQLTRIAGRALSPAAQLLRDEVLAQAAGSRQG